MPQEEFKQWLYSLCEPGKILDTGEYCFVSEIQADEPIFAYEVTPEGGTFHAWPDKS